MMPQVFRFPAVLSDNGGLIIVPSAPQGSFVEVIVVKAADRSTTGTLSFAGAAQAVINFDSSGTVPLGYVLYNPAPNVFIEQTVRNVVNYLTQNRLSA